MRVLAWERARVEYDLWGLLGERPADAIEAVEIGGAVVELDLREPSEPSEEPLGVDEIAEMIPAPLPRVKVDGVVRLWTEGGEIAARKVTMGGGERTLTLSVEGLALPDPWAEGVPESYALELERPDRREIVLRTEDEILGVRIREVRGRVEGPAKWQARASLGLLDGELEARINPEALEAQATGLELAKLPRWLGELIPELQPLPSGGTVGFDLRIPAWREVALRAEIEATISNLAWREIERGDLNIEARWDGNAADVVALRAVLDGSRIEVAAARLDPELPFVMDKVGTLDLEVPDLAALLTRLGVDAGGWTWPRAPVSVTAKINGRPAERVEIGELEVKSGEARLTFRGSAALPADPASWRETTVEVEVEGVLPDFEDSLALVLDPGVLRGSGRIAGRLDGVLVDPHATAEIAARDISVQGQAVGSVDVTAELRWPRLHLRQLEVHGELADVSAQAGLDLALAEIESMDFDARLSELARLTALVPEASSLGGAARLAGSATKRAGTWSAGYSGEVELTGSDVTWDGHAVGSAVLQIRGEWPRFEVARVEIAGPLGEVAAAGTCDLASERPAVALEGVRIRLPDLAALSATLPDLPRLAGSLEIQADLVRDADAPWTVLNGDVTIRGTDFLVEGTTIQRLEAQLAARGEALDLALLEAAGPWGRARVRGGAQLGEDGGSLRIEEIDSELQGYPLSLAKPTELRWSKDGTVEVDDLLLRALGGEIAGQLRWGPEVLVALEGRGLDLSGLPSELDLQGRVDLRLSASGPRASPTVDLEIRGPELGWRSEKASLDVAAHHDAGGLRVASLDLRVGESSAISGSGSLPIRIVEGRLEVGAWEGTRFSLRGESRDVALARRFGVPEAASWEALEVDVEIADGVISARGALEDPRWRIEEEDVDPDLRIAFAARADATSTVVKVNAPAGRYAGLDGEVQIGAGIDWNDLGGWLARLQEAPLQGNLSAEIPRLEAFRTMAGLRALEGSARVEARVSGSLAAPRPEGQLNVAGLKVKSAGEVPTFSDGRVEIRIDGPMIRIETVEGLLGYAPVKVTGTVALPEGEGGSPRIDLQIDGQNSLLVRNQDLRLRADLDIAVAGPLEELLISGTIRVTDALFSRPIDLTATTTPSADQRFQLFSLRQPPLSAARFDLKILADRSIRVQNRFAKGEISADLALQGTGEVPRPEGRAFATDLRVKLPFSRLNVSRGDLIFDRTDPFAPKVEVRGDTRLQGYDLDVSVRGRLPDVQILVQSDPHLHQEEALLLLTVGATPAGLEREGLSSAAMTRIGTLVGESLLAGLPGPGESESFADRINVEIGRDVSHTGNSTVDVEYRLTDKGPWHLHTERDRYDDYNFGVIWRVRFK